MKKIILTVAVFIMLTLYIASTACAKENMIIYSARFGGSQYFAGNVMADLINNNSEKYTATNLETSGSIENIKQDAGDAKALAQTIRLVLAINYYAATNGQVPFDQKYEDYRVTFSYSASAAGSFVVTDPKIQSVADLAGKKVGVGERGSAFMNETYFLLETCLGIWDEVKKEYLGYSAAADAFMDDLVDAIYAPGNLTSSGSFNPQGGLQNMLTLKQGMHIVALDAEEIHHGTDKNNWPRFPMMQMKANAIAPNFPDKPKNCFLIQLVALVHKSVPEEMVYELVKLCAENPERFREAHVNLSIMSPEVMAWLPVKTEAEIHPGALRYYKEQNIPLLINGATPDIIP